jgi:hypothetical protein
MPGYNAKTGAARIPPQERRLHQSFCPLSRAFGCHYATLGSNPRKPPPPPTKSWKEFRCLVCPVVVEDHDG